MALETYNKAKDCALALLLIFIAGVAWDIRGTVAVLHDDNIVTKKDMESTKKEVEEVKVSVKESRAVIDQNTDDIKAIQAILNREERYWREKKRPTQTED